MNAQTNSIASTIVEFAENEKVDLIVVGTRGASGVKRMLLGSVASGVVTYAHCPVLVVK
jgi:nucleotide-binding universal stress UspA family protein